MSNVTMQDSKKKYEKLYIHGLEITITHPKGSKRKFITARGIVEKVCKNPYGYINHTTAEDGEHVDVFIGPHPKSQLAFLVEFLSRGGRKEETKVIIGVNNIQQARQIIIDNYSNNFYETRIKSVKPILIQNLKEWLKKERPYKQISKKSSVVTSLDKDENEFAPGIPNKDDYGSLDWIKPGDKLTLVVQKHLADRAGPHYDIRLGNQDYGLLSWASRKGLPQVGQKVLAIRQPRHTFEYKDFAGIISQGYGKGEVVKEMELPVFVTKISPKSIHFSTADQRPQRFVLLATDDKNYLLMNTTPSEPLPYKKISYRSIKRDSNIDDVFEKIPNTAEIQPKIDGSLAIVTINGDNIDIYSHRISRKTGRPIFHTERVFTGTRPSGKNFQKWNGTILLGELYAEDKNGNVLPPNELAAILNSNLEKSIDKLKQKNIKLKIAFFDTYKVKGKQMDFLNTDYAQRKAVLAEILNDLGIDQFHLMPGWAKGETARRKMFEIMSGENHITREGIVIHPPRGIPIKMKAFDEADVYIKEIFRGQGKYGESAGGIIYSLTPDGPAVGKVGTGLTDELRDLLMSNPQEYKGRVIRIAYTEKLPSGAYRNPVFIGFHEDKN